LIPTGSGNSGFFCFFLFRPTQNRGERKIDFYNESHFIFLFPLTSLPTLSSKGSKGERAREKNAIRKICKFPFPNPATTVLTGVAP
jgi:hypothetical protein